MPRVNVEMKGPWMPPSRNPASPKQKFGYWLVQHYLPQSIADLLNDFGPEFEQYARAMPRPEGMPMMKPPPPLEAGSVVCVPSQTPVFATENAPDIWITLILAETDFRLQIEGSIRNRMPAVLRNMRDAWEQELGFKFPQMDFDLMLVPGGGFTMNTDLEVVSTWPRVSG